MSKPASTGNPAVVFKILSSSDWAEAQLRGSYAGSADDERDGFIHLSTGAQVAGTAARHFKHKPDLVLVALECAKLGGELVWEPSRGGALFPHLYAPLPVSAALWCKDMPLGTDGVPQVPGDIETC